MNKENSQIENTKEYIPSKDFSMLKAPIKKPKDTQIAEKSLIETYNFDEVRDMTPELEEFSVLSLYKSTRVHSHRFLLEKTQFLKHLPFQNIEKLLVSSSQSEALQKYFITGVVVEKKTLATSEKKSKKYPSTKSSSYLRFKLSDLKKYKSSLLARIASLKKTKTASFSDPKEEAYKMMSFTPDGYKVVD
jgi:hypothetical protein